MNFLLYNPLIVTSSSSKEGAVAINGDRISEIWYPEEDGTIDFSGTEIQYRSLPERFGKEFPDAGILDLTGKILMAGGIDAHVHFREPGMTGKADMESESVAALLGGVTSFIDMPNTNPPTISAERISEKCSLAKGRSHANYGFHIGATNSNAGEIEGMAEGKNRSVGPEGFGGIKIFMGSSTGNMLVDDDNALASLFSTAGKEILVHCEDETIIKRNLEAAKERYGDNIPFCAHEEIRSRKACIMSSIKALELAIRYGTRLHLLHVSTREELEMVRAAKMTNPSVTAETSVNYLWFSDKDYEDYGSRIKCNPSVKTEEDRRALIEALASGVIDTIGTDHAPHLLSEKDNTYTSAPSGIPSIQHSLPVLLTIADREGIPMERIASAFSEKAASIFGIKDRGRIKKGYFADIVIADPDRQYIVKTGDLAYKCGWSPYEGAVLKGYVDTVFVNGVRAVIDGRAADAPASGRQLVFNK